MKKNRKSILKLGSLMGCFAVASCLVFAGDDDDPKKINKKIEKEINRVARNTLSEDTMKQYYKLEDGYKRFLGKKKKSEKKNYNQRKKNNNNNFVSQVISTSNSIQQDLQAYQEPWLYYHQRKNTWYPAEAKDNGNNKEIMIVCEFFEKPSDYNSFAQYLATKGYTGIYLFHPVLLPNTSKSLVDFADDFYTIIDDLHNTGTRKRIDIITKGSSGLIVRHAVEQGKLAELPYIKNIAFLGTPHEGLSEDILKRTYSTNAFEQSVFKSQALQDINSSSAFISSLNNRKGVDSLKEIDYYTLSGMTVQNHSDGVVTSSNAHSNILNNISASWRDTNSHKKVASVDHKNLTNPSGISNVLDEWIKEWDQEKKNCTNNSTDTTKSQFATEGSSQEKNHTTLTSTTNSNFSGISWKGPDEKNKVEEKETKENLTPLDQNFVHLRDDCILYLKGAAISFGNTDAAIDINNTPFRLLFLDERTLNRIDYEVTSYSLFSNTITDNDPPLYYQAEDGTWIEFNEDTLPLLDHGCPLFVKHGNEYKFSAMAMIEKNNEPNIVYITKATFDTINLFLQ